MKQKTSKILRFVAICIGCLFIVSAFISKEIPTDERIRDVILGISILALATISIVRWLGILLLSILYGIASVISIFEDGADFYNLTLLIVTVFITIRFGRKIYLLIGRPRPRTTEAQMFPSSQGTDIPLSASSQTAASDNDIIVTSAEELQNFLSSHTLVDQIHTKVVGVTFNNNDGTSRQDILASCSGGEEISLQYFDYRGTPAYAVFSRYGQIGNLSKETAKLIDAKYDGCTVHGTITARTGGYGDFPFGCNILLEIYREKIVDTPPSNPSKFASSKTAAQLNHHDKSTSAKQAVVDDKFIAEAQWYAARGGTDLIDDE